MTIRKPGAALAASLLLAACLFNSPRPGNNQHAGGTIETTNGIALLPDGKPAARIQILLLEENGWLDNVKNGKSVILDSFRTDDTGYFEIKKDTSVKATLMASADSSGLLIRNFNKRLIEDEYRGKILLREYAAYNGQIADLESGAREVFLAGTPFSAPVDSAGNFSITRVPPESYPVVVRRVGADQAEEFVVAGEVTLVKSDTIVPPDTVKPDTSKILLVDDFEDEDNRTKLGPLLGGGYWDAYSDEYLGGNSRLTQPVNAAPVNFSGAIQDGGVGRENSLSVRYQAGTLAGQEKSYPFVFVEANLGVSQNGKYQHYNLTQMDTVSFHARGLGKLVVEFIQNQVGIPFHATAGVEVTLDTTWQLFKLAAADFKVNVSVFPAADNLEKSKKQLQESGLPAYSQKPTTWTEMGGMARTLRFLGTDQVRKDGSNFWIDDIRLHGLALDDLVK